MINDNSIISFNLLRCSSNFDGPTENFKTTDKEIITTINTLAKPYFSQNFNLNHVLAQIYENKSVINNNGNVSERKAKIKEHSDKTKDMEKSGLLVFTSFYKDLDYNKNKNKKTTINNDNTIKYDFFDYTYNDTTVLTTLKFKLKDQTNNPTLPNLFNIKLYPNSVLLIPLSSNRLYTHEIIPSTLPIQTIPTRLGYVIRCSKTKAIYKNGQTFIVEDNGELMKLEAQHGEVEDLKKLYYEENVTSNVIDYKKFNFSLNGGDYLKPIC